MYSENKLDLIFVCTVSANKSIGVAPGHVPALESASKAETNSSCPRARELTPPPLALYHRRHVFDEADKKLLLSLLDTDKDGEPLAGPGRYRGGGGRAVGCFDTTSIAITLAPGGSAQAPCHSRSSSTGGRRTRRVDAPPSRKPPHCTPRKL